MVKLSKLMNKTQSLITGFESVNFRSQIYVSHERCEKNAGAAQSRKQPDLLFMHTDDKEVY